jgi:hypothetical protein
MTRRAVGPVVIEAHDDDGPLSTDLVAAGVFGPVLVRLGVLVPGDPFRSAPCIRP